MEKAMKKRLTNVVVMVMALLMLGTTLVNRAYATEPEEKLEEDAVIVFLDGDSGVVATTASNSMTEFVNIRERSGVGCCTYTFTLGHACNLKFMLGAKYRNGNSGTMDMTLTGGNAMYQEYSMNMDGNVTIFDAGYAVPGSYTLFIWANDSSNSYIAAGSIYSMDY